MLVIIQWLWYLLITYIYWFCLCAKFFKQINLVKHSFLVTIYCETWQIWQKSNALKTTISCTLFSKVIRDVSYQRSGNFTWCFQMLDNLLFLVNFAKNLQGIVVSTHFAYLTPPAINGDQTKIFKPMFFFYLSYRQDNYIYLGESIIYDKHSHFSEKVPFYHYFTFFAYMYGMVLWWGATKGPIPTFLKE